VIARGWIVGGVLVAALLAGAAVWRAVAAAPAQAPSAAERAVAAGRALHATHCAVCHGETGVGDGPSAASFATKPSNLTDPLVGGMPDEYLRNVILHGGPAEGLSPGMPPFRGHVSDVQADELIAYIRSLGGAAAERPAPVVSVPGAPEQPILFSHLVHATRYQIPCQYCHSDARRSPAAGLPSVARCLGCHTVIGAQDNPEIAKIHEYARRGEPIPWVRVFKVPEFTYFPHKPHVRADVPCQTCHGPVERMRVVGARTGPRIANDLLHVLGLRPDPPLLSMGWCLECHREQNASRSLQAPLDCVACHH
jgi:mono/diheme cytochrome c family protein